MKRKIASQLGRFPYNSERALELLRLNNLKFQLINNPNMADIFYDAFSMARYTAWIRNNREGFGRKRLSYALAFRNFLEVTEKNHE
jgi:hypothetical protein